MSAPALIRLADLQRLARVVRAEGVEAQVEIDPGGRTSFRITPISNTTPKSANPFDGLIGK